jgi:mannosyltransferase OCH1-like enzyme
MVIKIIHQVWINDTFYGKTKKDIPEKWLKGPEMWKKYHPDWEYILWTDDKSRQLIQEKHPEYLDIYDNMEYLIQRADMIRYFILYDFGGMYIDLDMYPSENIEKYLKCDTDYFVYSPNLHYFSNGLIISTYKSQIMKDIIIELKKNLPWWSFGKHLKVMNSTGSLMLTRVLKKTQYVFSVLPKSKFNPYSVVEKSNQNKKSVIHTINVNESSWNSVDSKIYNFILKYRVFFITVGIIAILLIVIFLVYYIVKYKRCKNECEISCRR